MSDLRKAAQQALEAMEYMHQEKCDYMRRNNLGDPLREDAARLALPAITALRAALAEPEPLTSEQLRQIELGLRIYCDYDKYDLSLHDFARAIERAHGIGGSNE